MVEKRFSRTTQYLAAEIGNWVCGPKNPIFLRCRLPGDCPPRSFGRKTGRKALPLNEEEDHNFSSPDKATFKPSGAFRSEEIRLSRNPTWGGRPWDGMVVRGKESEKPIAFAAVSSGESLPSPTPSEKAGGSSFSPATFWLHCGEADIGKEGVGETSVGFPFFKTLSGPVSESLKEEFAGFSSVDLLPNVSEGFPVSGRAGKRGLEGSDGLARFGEEILASRA